MGTLKYLTIGLALALPYTAHAQEKNSAKPWPSKPVKLIVAHSPGGGSDVLARLLSQKLGESFKSTFVVENKPGAAGNIAAANVANATPDGYTFLVTTASVAVNPSLYKAPGYRLGENLVGVTQLASVPLALVANTNLGVGSISELLAKAKTLPAGLNSASNGSGTTSHLAAVMFAQATGEKVVNIPYKGSAPAVTALMAGETDIGFTSIISAKGALDSGRVRALAVTTKTRSPELPNTPTLDSFIPGFEIDQWYGVFASAEVNADILNKLSSAINRILNEKEVLRYLAQEGATAVGSSPADFNQFLAAEQQKYKKLVASTNLQVD